MCEFHSVSSCIGGESIFLVYIFFGLNCGKATNEHGREHTTRGTKTHEEKKKESEGGSRNEWVKHQAEDVRIRREPTFKRLRPSLMHTLEPTSCRGSRPDLESAQPST